MKSRPPHAAFAAVAVGVAAALGACSRCTSDETPAPAPVPVGAVEDAGGGPRSSRSAEPRAEHAWLDGGVDPACSGASIDLAAVLADPRCAISGAAARAIRAALEGDAGAAALLRQEASRTADGRIELRLVNRGAAPVTLPLSWHPKIAAFVVLADDPAAKGIYELEAPRLDVAKTDERDGGLARFARIVIPAGGVALARIAVDPTIVRRVDGATKADAAPPRLHPGKWTLHVGQLVSDVDTGEPATVSWEVP